jgi:transposase
MDTKVVKAAPRRTRRRHSPEFKEQVIAACLHPGVSVAAIALANGLNTNMLRKWVRDHRAESVADQANAELAAAPSAMVQLTVAPNVPPAEIRLDVRRGGTTVQMAWPVDAVASLGQCLRELLG